MLNKYVTKIILATPEGSKKLNLGCGYMKMDGWTNVDCDPDVKPDVIADLEQRFPFEDGEYDVIYCRQTMEHIRDLHGFMRECNRVLREGGYLVATVPMFGCTAAVSDPDHVRFFIPETFMMFANPKFFQPSNHRGRGLFDLKAIRLYRHMIEGENENNAGRYFTEIEAELMKPAEGYWDTEEGKKSDSPCVESFICRK